MNMSYHSPKRFFFVSAFCIGIIGCSESSTIMIEIKDKCASGIQKCENKMTYTCTDDGIWSSGTPCPNGCNGNKCAAEQNPPKDDCTPQAKKCINDKAYVCLNNGKWDSGVFCDYGCNSDECAPSNVMPTSDCMSGEKRCSNATAYVCGNDNKWDGGTVCNFGCDGDECAENQVQPTHDCDSGDLKCENHRAYVCGNDNQWDDGTDCDYGCNGDKCAENQIQPVHDCDSGDLKCENHRAYVCGNDNQWDDGTDCDYGCKNNSICASKPTPDADILDVVFRKDGTAVNVAHSSLEVISKGKDVSTIYLDDLSRFSAVFNSTPGEKPNSFYKVDYASNQDVINRMSDGHSIELLFTLDKAWDDEVSPKPMSSHQAGGTGFQIGPNLSNNEAHQDIIFLPHVGGKYIYVHSNIVPTLGKYYHVIGTWDKAAGKASIYVNGRLMNTVDAVGELKFGEQKWFGIGADAYTQDQGESAWNGKIVIARIYDAPLNYERVKALYELTGLADEVHSGAPKAQNREAFRFSSIYDVAPSTGKLYYKTFVPYDDTYTMKCSKASKLSILDADGKEIASGTTSLNAQLKKGEIVYVYIESPVGQYFDLIVEALVHKVELPFDIQSTVDPASFKTTSAPSENPMKPAELKYVKRLNDRALYTYSNSPENMNARNVNTCLTVADVTEKDVFFTFEHNNTLLSANNRTGYYGYRVINTGNEDLYITVKNLGYQNGNHGTWLGEDEWIKFYNLNFITLSDQLTSIQLDTLDNYYGFCHSHDANNGKCTPFKTDNRSPITYRIPSGKYIYVIGGSESDRSANHMNINVFNSANVTAEGAVANGAVLFSTHGSTAKAEFVFYTNSDTLANNMKTNVQNGYDMGIDDKGNSTIGHIGFDNFAGVVDSNLVWIFNDNTKGGYLPVKYSNPYYVCKGDECNSYSGNAFSSISANDMKQKDYPNATEWKTHINPNNSIDAVGEDLARFHTIRSDSKAYIIADYKHYAKHGGISDGFGNWMTDYIETFTLVNQGNSEREFTYIIKCNGALASFVREPNGLISNTYTPQYSIYKAIWDSNVNGWGSNSILNNYFKYKVKVPAHSVKQFSVEYNLLANSAGTVTHRACLDADCKF